MQPVARHVQVLGAEAGAAAEALRDARRRHGEPARAAPADSVKSTSGHAHFRQPGIRPKFSRADQTGGSAPSPPLPAFPAPEKDPRCREMSPGLLTASPSTRQGLGAPPRPFATSLFCKLGAFGEPASCTGTVRGALSFYRVFSDEPSNSVRLSWGLAFFPPPRVPVPVLPWPPAVS